MIYVLAIFGAVAVLIYLFYGTIHVEVTETKVSSDRVNGELRIVQISDLHGRTKFWSGTVGDIVDSLKPDIVCVTGDLFNKLEQLPEVMRELTGLRCTYVYFVPGNHEWEEKTGFRKRKLTEAEHIDVLRKIGTRNIRVLANDGELVEMKNSRILVYGFDNSVYGRERYNPPQEQLEGAFRLTLGHSPGIVRWLDQRSIGYDLLLAGHTHGGQIRLFGKSLWPYNRYHTGLKEMKPNQYVYVNRGLGTVHLPLRFGCRPEIALIRVTGKP
ncbi:metallophosphoesterase [Paenibacillus sp. GYB004]|uniref:metallophosphoesterase n=1 Tax=Paenibacillus sp. GYB004 TaxID=2994393 RepID=UPI002F96347C